MSWSTAESDLRTALSDNATDKLRYRKSVFGECNGTNKLFKTLEFRRVTNFKTGLTEKLGVWKNGTLLTASDVSSDYVDTGDFELTSAPADGDRIEASYFIQWFNDTEIQQFLRIASNWLDRGDTYANIETGLRPSVLEYAKGEAYEKLALRWSERLSETYLLEDAVNKDRFAIVDTYKKWGADLKKSASNIRKEYYSRSGQNEIPASASIFGGVRDTVPKR